MLAGLRAGQMQLLKRDGNGKVTVSRNETDIIGWSADEILRGFLGIPNPTDLETASQVQRLQELRRIDSPSDKEQAELHQLRHSVSQNLLEGPIASQLDELTSLLQKAKAEVSSTPPQHPASEPEPRKRRRKSPLN